MSIRRLESRRDRNPPKTPGLNLVSLMDIFTILVFFLMVNSSEVEILETTSDIKLPDSTIEQKPEDRLVIELSDQDLLVAGKSVTSISEVMGSEGDLIAPLYDALARAAAQTASQSPEVDSPLAVTIMGDKALPYAVLKKVIYTSQQAEFTRVALAVNQPAGESS